MPSSDKALDKALKQRGISRRTFLTYCSAVAVAMGLAPILGLDIAKALATPSKPDVLFLHNAGCTGCSEALLRASDQEYTQTWENLLSQPLQGLPGQVDLAPLAKSAFPLFEALLFNTLAISYHESLMAAAGDRAENSLQRTLESSKGFIAIMEGALPTGMNGNFGKINNKTMLEISRTVLNHKNCQLILSLGTCAAYGGVQAATPNPTGAQGIGATFPDLTPKIINISGCPPNPMNLVGTLVYYLQQKQLPQLDSVGRPLMFYAQTVHERCERRHHYRLGQFADSFHSEKARKGWCLYNLGCKGPITYNNCPQIKFNNTNWPVGAGHPCLGCSEPDFWDDMAPYYE